MIALGSEGRPLALSYRQSALGGRQIRRYEVPRAVGIRRDVLFADTDAERRGRAMSVEALRLSMLTPNHPDNPDELRWNML